MELRQLEYFVEVARDEHVSMAAETLHVAQSAISRQVKLLEKELGVELFEREGRNVKLTFIGELFLEQAIFALKANEKSMKRRDGSPVSQENRPLFRGQNRKWGGNETIFYNCKRKYDKR
jgi:DNA-binding transcriptional LysR family regulator